MKRAPFDPESDFDAIADATRVAMVDAMLQVVRSPRYAKAQPSDRAMALLSGAMVAAIGAGIAGIRPGSEAELRAFITTSIPHWFDLAAGIQDRPQLGELN